MVDGKPSEITPKHIYLSRKEFMKAGAALGASALLAACGIKPREGISLVPQGELGVYSGLLPSGWSLVNAEAVDEKSELLRGDVITGSGETVASKVIFPGERVGEVYRNKTREMRQKAGFFLEWLWADKQMGQAPIEVAGRIFAVSDTALAGVSELNEHSGTANGWTVNGKELAYSFIDQALKNEHMIYTLGHEIAHLLVETGQQQGPLWLDDTKGGIWCFAKGRPAIIIRAEEGQAAGGKLKADVINLEEMIATIFGLAALKQDAQNSGGLLKWLKLIDEAEDVSIKEIVASSELFNGISMTDEAKDALSALMDMAEKICQHEDLRSLLVRAIINPSEEDNPLTAWGEIGRLILNRADAPDRLKVGSDKIRDLGFHYARKLDKGNPLIVELDLPEIEGMTMEEMLNYFQTNFTTNEAIESLIPGW